MNLQIAWNKNNGNEKTNDSVIAYKYIKKNYFKVYCSFAAIDIYFTFNLHFHNNNYLSEWGVLGGVVVHKEVLENTWKLQNK